MTYMRAPITEAVIDIRVTPAPSLQVDRLRALANGLEERYPRVGDSLQLFAQFRVGGLGQTTEPVKVGYQFSGPNQSFHAQLGGWSFSRQAPYESWEAFQTEARELWVRYRSVVAPENIVRIAVRYVNRIDLPLPIADLSKYLRTFPEVSADLPQNLAGYFMQLQIPFEEFKVMINLNQAIVPPPRHDVVSLVLDLDVWRISDIPQDEDGMWELFSTLREVKNRAFEACITDETRELFR
jgi:uncharacterized protein (TIGR04255 family)